jgi:hypothetical protein
MFSSMSSCRHERHLLRSRRQPGQRLGGSSNTLAAGIAGAATVLLSSCTASTASTGASTPAAATSSPAVSAAARITDPGGLAFSPASGPTTQSPVWITKGGCPAGHNGSAELAAFNLKGVFESRISLPIEGPGPYQSGPGSGVLDFNLKKVLLYATPDVAPNGTIEVAVACYSGGAGLGQPVYVQAAFIHYSDGGARYTTSSTG